VDALILAAGLGTRLRPLTDHTPKPLIPVGGVPMLERVARRLIAAGVDRLIVNVSHLAERIERFVERRDGFGVEVLISREPAVPLETGGAILAARPHLRGDRPFFVHNADVLTDLPLEGLYGAHDAGGDPLAVLAVSGRASARRILFDDDGLLGRVDAERGVDRRVREGRGPVRALAFNGVHVVSARFPGLIVETGAFSVLEPYLRLAGEGERILPFEVDAYRWMDIGRPEHLEAARALFPAGP
jgi:N-acetyl-alpha-D-muramate 1-phosphate uridylyltransferase